jgi:hypothetical protein
MFEHPESLERVARERIAERTRLAGARRELRATEDWRSGWRFRAAMILRRAANSLDARAQTPAEAAARSYPPS